MKRDFFRNKIRSTSNDNLRRLLHFRTTENCEIVLLAREEAKNRNLPYEDINPPIEESRLSSYTEDLSALEVWNWAAFLFTPFWTLAHKLDKWTVAWFIPGINIVACFYLGFYGSRLAYKKNRTVPVDVFLVIQKEWNFWAIRIFLAGSLLWVAAKAVSGP